MSMKRRKGAAVTYRIPDDATEAASSTSSVHQYTDVANGRITQGAAVHQTTSVGPAPPLEAPVLRPDIPHDDTPDDGPSVGFEYDLAEYARELRDSDDPQRQWMTDHRQEFLAELLRLEGRGEHRYAMCAGCGEGEALHRCNDCFNGGRLLCQTCVVREHRWLPLHRIQRWTGLHFERCTLKDLGLRIQLGHWHECDRACPLPIHSAGDDFVLVDVHGVYEVGLDFCGCSSSGSMTTQLLRAGYYPATTTNPRTAATFRVLRHYEFSFYEAKSGVYEYYYSIARLTDNSGLLVVKDRYDEFLRMTKQWRSLQVLKRAGRGHCPDGIAGTQPGECALLCPACPQPGKNLPDDWKEKPEEKQFLYALFLAIDANFRLRRKDVSSEEKDPGFSEGWAFYCNVKEYLAHVKKHWDDRQPRSRCVAHDAVDKPDRDARGTASYTNSDYMFFRSIVSSNLIRFYVSYDIACQWHIHLWERMQRYDNELLTIDGSKRYFAFLVPKFHLPAHIEECNITHSFHLTRFVGMTDGEAPERVWAATNPLAGSTMNMGPGSRRDTLDDFFNDQNHKKILALGRVMREKVKEAAPLVIQTRQALLDLEGGLEPATVAAWSKMVEKWEGGCWEAPNPHRNPFQATGKDDFLAGVRYKLAEEADAREAAGTESPGAVRDGTHVTQLIAGGLQLEEQQRTLKADGMALGVHATDRQRAGMLERSSKLRRKLFAWMDIQSQFFPIVNHLRVKDDEARALVATAHAQAVPGVAVTDIKLWLPSAIRGRPGANNTTDDNCTTEILRFEFRMRAGQCKEGLDSIRRNLLIRTHLYNLKDRYTRGVKANTRANVKIRVVEERIRRAVALYHAAWQALKVLGDSLGESKWRSTLKELKGDDVRGIPRARFADPARQRGGTSTQVATDEGASVLDGDPSSAKRRRVSSRQAAPALSWIWLGQSVSRKEGDPEENDEALRIEWARTRARALRWSEELDLLEEEMRRITEFLAWRAGWWESRIGLKTAVDLAEAEGCEAYARRQAKMKRLLSADFRRQWTPLPALIARTRESVAALEPEDLREKEHVDGEPEREEGSAMGDTPVPLGPPGAVLTDVDDD
ncbi:hypothetical protein C8F01DRAFT_1339499 [Mycena amicta]|nr:hypothetical protein C8F01DRAFT_1339499 [Mycena amicta]